MIRKAIVLSCWRIHLIWWSRKCVREHGGLNVCVPQIHMLDLMPSVTRVRRWDLWRVTGS